jgi:hypothetical protein
MNEALARQAEQNDKALEDTLRRVIREELQRAKRGGSPR